jgi:hypothetical protein
MDKGMSKVTTKRSVRARGVKRVGMIALSAMMIAATLAPSAVLAENSGGGNLR